MSPPPIVTAATNPARPAHKWTSTADQPDLGANQEGTEAEYLSLADVLGVPDETTARRLLALLNVPDEGGDLDAAA